jgi:hypothetical protein
VLANSVQEEEGSVMTVAAEFSTGRRPTDLRSRADDVSWRVLRSGLWVARRDGHHLGSIEHGRRWVASDAQSEPIGAFRTFQEAQDAVAEPGAHRAPESGPVPIRPALAVLGLCAAALASSAGWAWTSVLL